MKRGSGLQFHKSKAQGGLDQCYLAFYKEGDLGKDGIYDNWRLEGPSFVWYFRGTPHVHVWVNVADDPKVKLNSYQDSVGVYLRTVIERG
jgi:hypothetical protein